MGRRKIDIQPILDERKRGITFKLRKKGLIKKAMELSILTGIFFFLMRLLISSQVVK